MDLVDWRFGLNFISEALINVKFENEMGAPF
jgi:hypothetical protein